MFGLSTGGQPDEKTRPFADFALDPDVTAVPLHDAEGNGQPQAGPLADHFGREEGFEELVEVFGRNAAPRVGNRDFDALLRRRSTG